MENLTSIRMKNFQLPYIIAEVGSNHLGNKNLIRKSIYLAKNAGANCVKFQLFDENNLVHHKLKIYKHVKDKRLKYQHQRFKKVKITVEQIKQLSKIAKKIKIDISVTPFHHDYIKKIKKYVTFFKIASGDINNFQLLKEVSKSKKKVIISTGMSTLSEIKKALSFFPKNKVTLLHCMSSYPTAKSDANLINIRYLKNKFKVKTGYSDHVPGIEASANSVFFGAEVIEKHFLPKKTILAGDYKLSIDSSELKKMIQLIKVNYSMIGKLRLKEFKSEKYFKRTLRRSLYFKFNLKKDTKLKLTDIKIIRPFAISGIKIEDLSTVIGRRIKKNVKSGQLIKFKDLKK